MRLVAAGGSGQVGEMLARHWHAQGHTVTVLSRRALARPWQTLAWDGRTAGAWTDALEGADACINLAGRSVNCRYTEQNRAEILRSRVESTRLLREVIGGLRQPPPVWLNASTATIYRHTLDRDQSEESGEFGGHEPDAPRKWAFSVEVAKAWEEEFFAGPLPRTRRVALRSSLILSPDPGGIFSVLSRLVKLGLGGTNGPGNQMVSWIHERDFLQAVDVLLADDSWQGPVNITAPYPVPNREFMRILREAWGVKIGLPATTWMLALGGLAMRTEPELVLKSRRVVPARLLAVGFQFAFPHWEQAARDLMARARRSRG